MPLEAAPKSEVLSLHPAALCAIAERFEPQHIAAT